LLFPPTYRYARGAREVYEYRKQKANYVKINTPSWCDRVLWKTMPNLFVDLKSYGCTQNITTSDHSPVFASFELQYNNQCVARRGFILLLFYSMLVAKPVLLLGMYRRAALWMYRRPHASSRFVSRPLPSTRPGPPTFTLRFIRISSRKVPIGPPLVVYRIRALSLEQRCENREGEVCHFHVLMNVVFFFCGGYIRSRRAKLAANLLL
jgi:hypothetical protein